MPGLVSAVKDRLTAQVTDFKNVAGAVELASALERKQFLANAYVVPLESQPGPNQVMSGVSQNTKRGIAVVFQVRRANDPTGGAAALDALEARINQVIAAVLGWKPSDDYTAFQYAGGRLLDFIDSAVIWTEEFTTSYLVRSTP